MVKHPNLRRYGQTRTSADFICLGCKELPDSRPSIWTITLVNAPSHNGYIAPLFKVLGGSRHKYLTLRKNNAGPTIHYPHRTQSGICQASINSVKCEGIRKGAWYPMNLTAVADPQNLGNPREDLRYLRYSALSKPTPPDLSAWNIKIVW